MLRRFSLDFAIFSFLLDAALIALALGLAKSIRPGMSNLPYVKDLPGQVWFPSFLYILFPILWTLILLSFSVYDSRRNLRVWKELASLSGGSLLAIIAVAGILYLTYRDTSRFIFVSFAGFAFAFILIWRMLYRMFFRLGIIKSVQPRKILIVGYGALGTELEKQVHAYNSLGLTVVGYIDDNQQEYTQDKGVIGPLSAAQQIVKDYQVDDVVVSLSPQDYDRVLQVVSDLSKLPVKLWVIPDYFKLALYKINYDELAGIPMLDLRAPALSDTQRLVKRSFDLFITIIFSPIYLLVMGLTAVCIRLDSPGPVIFRQQRTGENGRLFYLYKFRSMVAHAEELHQLVEQTDAQGHLIHKTQDDPRVTRVGRYLRRASLDELPQLLNVLRGEMSLVGPRPELPQLVNQYEPWQYKRFSVPPGMTGWWQVHGRSNNPMHLHTQDDLYYIENYSIILDISILIKTIGVVLSKKGAY